MTRISESDLRFLVETVATRRTDHESLVELLRDKPDILDRMLDDDNLFRRLSADEESIVRVSPWLLFTILLRQAAKEMPNYSYTMERVSGSQRLPVFDGSRVSELVQDRSVVDYLAEMLTSFVRTDSAVFYYKSGRRYRRRSFSDMDVDDMIALAGAVSDENRFPFYRRIGDICLFIVGVFPEHAAVEDMAEPASRRRPGLRRQRRSFGEYEAEAVRFYRLAAAHPTAEHAGLRFVLETLADNFGLARKPLTFMVDHYIKPYRERLFGQSA